MRMRSTEQERKDLRERKREKKKRNQKSPQFTGWVRVEINCHGDPILENRTTRWELKMLGKRVAERAWEGECVQSHNRTC